MRVRLTGAMATAIGALSGVVLDTKDPQALASFYERLLGWTRTQDEDDWVKLMPPEGATGLSFQLEPQHRAPTWPSGEAEQMQVHLDFQVGDLAAATAHAVASGATLAEWQPQDDVRVMLDPDGHPFCLFT
jgi:catechol 2,3-dioxygenase-like lactoylglutathione lyase family enzyme